jgi:hypothetical protein
VWALLACAIKTIKIKIVARPAICISSLVHITKPVLMDFQRSLRIPIAGSDGSDFVEVFPDELPSDVNDLLDVLKAEVAPLKIWKEAAVRLFI